MNKYKNMFFDVEGGGGGGGDAIAGTGGDVSRGAEAFEPAVKQTTGDRPVPEAKPKEHSEGVPTGSPGPERAETPPAAQPGFDPSKFAQEFGASLTESLKPILATKSEPQMSPEEARKLLNIWEPDDAWYAQYDNLETRKSAVSTMRDALIRQADTLASYRMEEALDKMRNEFAPHLQEIERTNNVAREERFRTGYPQLKSPALQPLIKAVAEDLVARKQTFQTEPELFKALANGVEAVIKVNNPEFKLVTAENGSDQIEEKGRGGRQLPTSTPGGGGGTGRREGGAKPERPRGIAIFEGK